MNGFCSIFVVKLLSLSLKATITTGLIFALRMVFIAKKKARYSHILWFALLFQLALPLELETGWSKLRFMRMDELLLSGLIPAPEPRTSEAPVSPAGTADHTAPGGPAGLPIFPLLFAVWISGAAISGARTARRHALFRRNAMKSSAPCHPRVLDVFESAKSAMSLASRVRILQTPNVSTACVHGILRSTVFMPRWMIEAFSEKEIECVLLHELSHIKRKDLWVDAAVTLLGVLYWFHPAVIPAFRALRRDREYACDASAISALGGEKARRYGTTLLHALERFTPSPSPQCALGRMDNRTHLRRRISMIASFDGKPSRVYQAGAAFFIAVVLVFGSIAAGAQEGKRPVFQPPVHASTVTLDYGWTVHPLTGKPYFHQGMDTAEPIGTPVLAIADGEVVAVSFGDELGNHVVIRHAEGFSSMYAKLKHVEVKQGQIVKAGQTIGLSGNTGVSTGPHLHFALMKDNKAVDPKEFILF